MKLIKNYKCDTRGAVIVEVAILLPIILLLAIATIEFASALVAYKRLVNQTRVAARWLSTQTPGQGHITAICLVKYNNTNNSLPCSGSLILDNLNNATVSISDATTDPASQRAQRTNAPNAVAINLVTVTVSGYRHPLILGGFLKPITGGAASVSFSSIRTTMRQVS